MRLRLKPRAAQSGVSLIIVLIMLGVIALMSAATLRHSRSNQRISDHVRMPVLAQHYAEAAFLSCSPRSTLSHAPRLGAVRQVDLSSYAL